jgi:hypothetical protein
MAREIGIETIEAASGPGLGIVHAPGPEPALTIGLAIVEAVLPSLGLGSDGQRRAAGLGIEKVKARAQGQHQATSGAHRQRAHVLRHRPVLVLPATRVEAVHASAFDVDPVECLLGNIPERALPQERTGRQDTRHIHDVTGRRPPESA